MYAMHPLPFPYLEHCQLVPVHVLYSVHMVHMQHMQALVMYATHTA